jgi:hypothetical protein
VDLTAIVTALAAAETVDPVKPREDRHRHAHLQQKLANTKARIAVLEQENRELNSRLAGIAALAAGSASSAADTASVVASRPQTEAKPVRQLRVVSNAPAVSGNGIRPAARKLMTAAAQHAPALSPAGAFQRRPQRSVRGRLCRRNERPGGGDAERVEDGWRSAA